MKRPFGRILVALAVIAVAIQFVPVERSNPVVSPDLELHASVTDVLARSCYDCHSHHTSWPWYSRVAPVSWLISHHVKEGRGKLNFSLWQQYPPEARQRLATEAVEEIDQEEMPLPMHLVLHPDAKVSASDRDRLAAWGQTLRPGPSGGGQSGE